MKTFVKWLGSIAFVVITLYSITTCDNGITATDPYPTVTDPYPKESFYGTWSLVENTVYGAGSRIMVITNDSYNDTDFSVNFDQGYLYQTITSWTLVENPRKDKDPTNNYSDYPYGYKIVGTVTSASGWWENYLGANNTRYLYMHKNGQRLIPGSSADGRPPDQVLPYERK